VRIGDLRPGPLWGPRSWNDGAGAARTHTLASYLRHAMPYTAPGSLSDEEAQLIAAYIESQPRPAFDAKDRDFLVEPMPPDAVYYRPGH
jgi:thiosulfate dehydrogenase